MEDGGWRSAACKSSSSSSSSSNMSRSDSRNRNAVTRRFATEFEDEDEDEDEDDAKAFARMARIGSSKWRKQRIADKAVRAPVQILRFELRAEDD